MLDKLFPKDPGGAVVRSEALPESGHRLLGHALDLRSQDPSRARDRAAHRRSTWLYEDMLN